ncbi:50S ribosomal protein L5 [Gordonia sp. zg691]|uniref:Large ribosomal subunit protein uL5 n=1 Tax=Gordonia jinghuaiqii TaxID=2758710 RepID=A0A7D7LSW9_9ACTN|nr:50S ribosomal protein L5 [Gordonia jinghuaiqii]MBD0860938.1 50S ribosomal protein L5 [Gordonia jinghuaiqii]MCR5979503.1 50S ribosomal protein L5 [Gordonia jinghuaiqii]QMT00701.1 50S ribosomal protein L5 [Gordonia jinghuaiqii]
MTSTEIENGSTESKVQPRLKTRYREEIKDTLNKEFDYANVMLIPGVVKVVVNMGVGDAARDAKLINGAVEDLAKITGQKPEIRRARKSIAQFKLREGMPIGARVTLRGDRMWEFLDRLVSIALPRIRDFRGLSDRQFDGNGNYTFGLNEQSMFHEINIDNIDRPRGMDITVVTSATTDEEGRALLRALGFPFKDNNVKDN